MTAELLPMLLGGLVGHHLTARSYPRPQPLETPEGFAFEERRRLDVATHELAMVAYGRTLAQRVIAFGFWSAAGWGVASFVAWMVAQ